MINSNSPSTTRIKILPPLSSKNNNLTAKENKLETKISQIEEDHVSMIPQDRAQKYSKVLQEYSQKIKLLIHLGNDFKKPENNSGKVKGLIDILNKTASELKDSFTFLTLEDYIQANVQEHESLSALKQNQNLQTRKLEKLKREYLTEKSKLDKDMETLNDKITILSDTKSELKQLCAHRQKYVKKELLAIENYQVETSAEDEEDKKKELKYLQHLLDHEKQAHSQAIDFLHWQRSQLDKEVEKLMLKYETDLDNKTKDLDHLKQRKSDTNDKYEDLLMEYENISRVLEEEKEVRRKTAEDRKLKRARYRSALCIQRWYRAIKAARKAKRAAKSKAKKK